MGVLAARPRSTRAASEFVDRKPDHLWALAVWFIYSALLGLIVANHEPWFDEAQAWLLARDVSPFQLFIHYLRYEGSPGLWHLLLMIPAKLGVPYRFMSWIAWGVASAGSLILLLRAPFPIWIRYSLPFSFYLLYQYAAVSRSYVLLPALLFLIACLYNNALDNLVWVTILTVLLANVSLHGFVLSASIVVALVARISKEWPFLNHSRRKAYLALLVIVAAIGMGIMLQLKRPADLAGFGILNFNVRHLAIVSALKLRDAFTGYFVLSVPLLLVSIVWFYRRGTLLLYSLGTFGLLLLAGIAYSNVWHEGSLVLWWLFGMWVSWRKPPARIPKPLTICFAGFLAIQLFWSASTVKFDLRFPYSGSQALARYIVANNLRLQDMVAFGPKCTAILPYFARGAYANWPQDQGFWDWSTHNLIDDSFLPVLATHPRVVIIAITHDSDDVTRRQRIALLTRGYKLNRRFDGALYWKYQILEDNDYELYVKSGQDSFGPA